MNWTYSRPQRDQYFQTTFSDVLTVALHQNSKTYLEQYFLHSIILESLTEHKTVAAGCPHKPVNTRITNKNIPKKETTKYSLLTKKEAGLTDLSMIFSQWFFFYSAPVSFLK